MKGNSCMEYELFKKEFQFTGRHARMVEEMWDKNDAEHSYFTRLIDLYITAAVIGFRTGNKVCVDYSDISPKSVFPEQLIGAKEDLDFILQMMLIIENQDLHTDNNRTEEDYIKKAFKEIESREEYEYYQNYFNDYVRGGVEVLYDMLIVRTPEPEEAYDRKSANILALLKKYN